MRKLRGIEFLILAGVLLLCFLISKVVFCILLLVCLAVVGLFILKEMGVFKSGSIIQRMKAADDKHLFFGEAIINFGMSYDRLKELEGYFKGYDTDSSIFRAYSLISERLNNIYQSALKYIEAHAGRGTPANRRVQMMSREAIDLSLKLRDLRDMAMQIDETAGNVDISYADDLIEALGSMQDSSY